MTTGHCELPEMWNWWTKREIAIKRKKASPSAGAEILQTSHFVTEHTGKYGVKVNGQQNENI